MSDEVKKIRDTIEPIMAEGGETKTLDEFIDELVELKSKHASSVYGDLEVAAVQKAGAGIVLLYGVRDESAEELKVRENREAGERTNIEQAELKEYLRLKKKYGKKGE